MIMTEVKRLVKMKLQEFHSENKKDARNCVFFIFQEVNRWNERNLFAKALKACIIYRPARSKRAGREQKHSIQRMAEVVANRGFCR